VFTFIRDIFRKYFVVGLIVVLPFAITIKFLFFIVDYFDQTLEVRHGRFLYVIPQEFHPDYFLGVHIPGLGVAFTVLIILLVGILSRYYFGTRLISAGESAMNRIPMLRAIYRMVKEILRTYSSRSGSQFSRVVLIEYPRTGIHTLAFVTGTATGELADKKSDPMLNIFVPTTPNPTSGFYLLIPESQTRTLNLTVEAAFKIIISGGIVSSDVSRW
jgi:uncharacterized membrane protein